MTGDRPDWVSRVDRAFAEAPPGYGHIWDRHPISPGEPIHCYACGLATTGGHVLMGTRCDVVAEFAAGGHNVGKPHPGATCAPPKGGLCSF